MSPRIHPRSLDHSWRLRADVNRRSVPTVPPALQLWDLRVFVPPRLGSSDHGPTGYLATSVTHQADMLSPWIDCPSLKAETQSRNGQPRLTDDDP
jgi:hypothetical protein